MASRLVITLCAMIMISASSAQAAGCYSKAEIEAEQGIRIHSELMVIGLNCQHMGAREGLNLYSEYRKITARHSKLFEKYESILMAYFAKNGGGKAEAQLNTLRTGFANKISNDVAAMRPDVFCSRYASRITQASAMNQNEVRQWASTVYPGHPVSRPMCAGG